MPSLSLYVSREKWYRYLKIASFASFMFCNNICKLEIKYLHNMKNWSVVIRFFFLFKTNSKWRSPCLIAFFQRYKERYSANLIYCDLFIVYVIYNNQYVYMCIFNTHLLSASSDALSTDPPMHFLCPNRQFGFCLWKRNALGIISWWHFCMECRLFLLHVL